MTTAKRYRLAQRRKAMGFSQEQLAERLEVDRSTVVRWESGDNEPQPWVRPRLAEVLQVSLDQLTGSQSCWRASRGRPRSSLYGLPP